MNFFHKAVAFVVLTAFAFSVHADPIDTATAIKAGKAYLANACEEKVNVQLSMRQTLRGEDGSATLYIFDIDEYGFILVSADDLVEPVLGYSFNGIYDETRISPNFRHWLEGCSADIYAIAHRQSEVEPLVAAMAKEEWTALRTQDFEYYARKAKNNVDPLITTHWEQGGGYNNFCPVFSQGPNGHSYVGCVATAMAQIIRYYGYPTTGFGSSSYSHHDYGRQTAFHDSVVYDYANMPEYVSIYSPAVQQNAVSLLCYHCGVSVKMNYQNSNHTSGSGASTEDVVDGLVHFGYFNTRFAYKNNMEDSEWKAIIRNELDQSRPVLYSGSESTQSGHAFVCDGYRGSTDKYHFNWGWGGYQDGYFTMTNMNGFSRAQSAVFNIYPSGLAANLDTTYVAADGTGDGSSWQSPTPCLNESILVRGFYKSGHIWVKEGTYKGDSLSNCVIQLKNGIRIYGGFAGTESGINQRQPELHPTILDGEGVRAIVSGQGFSKTTHFKDFVLQNGNSANVSAIKVSDNLTASGITIKNCIATGSGNIVSMIGGTFEIADLENNMADSASGSIIKISDGTIRRVIVRNNSAAIAVASDGGKLYNSLITHNNATGIRCDDAYSSVVNCDITYNNGVGLSLLRANDIRNNLVAFNTIAIDTTDFPNVTFCAMDNDAPYAGNGNIQLTEPEKVFWMDMSPAGCHDTSDFAEYTWHLKTESPCIDAGDSNTNGIPNTDLEGKTRVVRGRIDIGCLEKSNVGIETAEESTFIAWPNPSATHILSIEGEEDADYMLYDIHGRCLRLIDHAPATMQLDLRSLPNGIYILRSEGGSMKVVLQ